MAILKKIREFITNKGSGQADRDAETAYDLWASSYDSQPDNLMLALDETVFSDLLFEITLTDKIIADVGCGTGRHWQKMLDKHPRKLIGFDVSDGMLVMLKQKFPQAVTHRMTNHQLHVLNNQSVDVLVSTLTVAHIENIEAALTEWNRVIQPGGDLIITDYHPVALARGGKRTFKHKEQTVAIINHVHSIDGIIESAKQLGWTMVELLEKNIDDTTRHYYEKQNALAVYEAWKGTPIIYGLHFKKHS